jgi:Transposase and inactivated derivatives
MDWKKLALEQAALIKQLQAQIVELEARIAMLEKNSRNSSKPPSSDIVKPPKTKPKGKRKKLKHGAQKGHKQNLRKPFEENQVDKTIELKLNACPTCGGRLTLSSEPSKKHQQVELVDQPFFVTEYQQLMYWCEHCQCYHYAALPSSIKKSGLFGPKLISLTAYLKGRGHMSYTTLKEFFKDALGISVSRGFLAKQVRKASNAMEKTYQELVDHLPNEPHAHIDETGCKENGEKRWIWCFRTGKLTLFHINPSRGSVVLENLLGIDYTGTISCDFWGAYKKFERMTSAELQLCWAHLIREVKFLAENKDKKVARYGRRLLKKIREMFSTIHHKDELLERNWLRRMRSHQNAILKVAWGTIPDDNNAINIAERLWNWQEEYFRFIDKNIPPTNNLGEQTIRKVVIDRKVTQGTRSDWGNRWQERFWSVLSTCEQQGTNVMSFLKSCVESFLHGLPPPLIIPK